MLWGHMMLFLAAMCISQWSGITKVHQGSVHDVLQCSYMFSPKCKRPNTTFGHFAIISVRIGETCNYTLFSILYPFLEDLFVHITALFS